MKIKIVHLFLLTALLCFPFALNAQKQLARFEIYEKEIVRKDLKEPDSEVELMATFTESFNKQHFVKGFYTGNNIWKIRFSPSNPKKWKVHYQFTDSDQVYYDEFTGTQDSVVQPVEINPINTIWFKRAVYPYFVRGLKIRWESILNNDTDYFRQLKLQGFNFLCLDEITGKGVSLASGNYKEFDKLEPALHSLWKMGFGVMMPVTLFDPVQAPRGKREWDNYFSAFISRFGVYRNILFYIPDRIGESFISAVEKNMILASLLANNPYSHPVSVSSDLTQPVINRYVQFCYHPGSIQVLNEQTKMPVIAPLPDDNQQLIPNLCRMFTSGISAFIETSLVKDKLILNQVNGLWSFFESLPYFEMKPSTDIADRRYCLGRKDEEYILLAERKEKIRLNLGENYYRATWINPFNISDKRDAGTLTGSTELLTPSGSGCWLLHLSQKESGFPQGIHLSWTKKPENSLTVTWTTVSGSNPCLVRYKEKGAPVWNEQKGRSEKSPGRVYIHWAVIEGLKPATEYEYQVSADENIPNVFSKVYMSKTAPEGKNSSFTFSWITDTGLDGRLDNNATGTIRVLNEVLSEKPDFLLGGGDYAYANRDKRFRTRYDNFDRWFSQYQPALSQMPFMAQFGNHELYLDETFEDWAPYFKHPDGFRNNKHYSFDVGSIHFTSFCLVDYLPDQEELEWLDNDLAKAREKGQWIIVYHHEPIFAYGTSHASKPEITNVIYPIFRKHNIDISLYSHDQNYERTFPLRGDDAVNPGFSPTEGKVYKKGEGTIFMKVSPCGKKSEIGNIFPLFQQSPPFMAVRDRTAHHLAIFSMQEGNKLEVRIYNVPEDDSPKYLIDRFIIVR